MYNTNDLPLVQDTLVEREPEQNGSYDTSPIEEQEQEVENGQYTCPIEKEEEENGPYTRPIEEEEQHPCDDLLADKRSEYNSICVPLYEASIKGDLEAAKELLGTHKERLGFSITKYKETALHIAATVQSIELVQYLVNEMTEKQLSFRNEQGFTALSLAAAAGNEDMAEIMLKDHPKLLKIRGDIKSGTNPLYHAALYEKHKMVVYLYDKAKNVGLDEWTHEEWRWVFQRCLEADIFDVALNILKDKKGFEPDAWGALDVLARKPNALKDVKPHMIRRIINSITCVKGPKESAAIQVLRRVWGKIVEKSKNEIDVILKGKVTRVRIGEEGDEKYPSRILFTAAEMGNTRFLVELISKYPDLIWEKNDDGLRIFHIAVSHRHESIYNMLYEIGSMKNFVTPLTDPYGNNMLHLVGMNPKLNALEDVSGAAFQMQRELMWFEEVKSMMSPSDRDKENIDGHTPRQLFIDNHTKLVSLGAKWMKGTASECMVVAALITTIVFSVAFNIPGGYDQIKGFPIFIQNGPFIAFIILDAISLVSSSTSILMFLSILTSRYAQQDFRKSLPRKLIVGLATLFLAIITMMVAFTVSFFVLYRKKLISVPIIISVVAIIPILLYVILQLPLFIDVYRSTYRSRYLFKPKERILYYQNPRV